MQKKKKFKLFNFLKKRNVKRFIIFFLIAFVFLIISKLSNSYKQNIKLKVSLTQLDNEIVLLNDSLNVVNAYVESNGFALLPYIFNATEPLTLNASNNLVKNEDHFIFNVEEHKYLISEQLGKSYDILTLRPKTLMLPYSKLATKYVPLRLKSDITYTPGFDLQDSLKVSVDSLKIVGAQQALNEIEFISTEAIELMDVKNNIDKLVKVDVSQYQDIEVFPKIISVNGQVSRFTEGTVEVPVSIINKPPNVEINYFPKYVKLTYYVDLERFNTVKPSDFRVECDYLKLKEDQNFFIAEITNKPDFVKRANIKQDRIDFIKL